jgi:hypothetical protein
VKRRLHFHVFGRCSFVYIEPRDVWVGVYVGPEDIFVCPLPCLVIRIGR